MIAFHEKASGAYKDFHTKIDTRNYSTIHQTKDKQITSKGKLMPNIRT